MAILATVVLLGSSSTPAPPHLITSSRTRPPQLVAGRIELTPLSRVERLSGKTEKRQKTKTKTMMRTEPPEERKRHIHVQHTPRVA